MLNLCKGNGFRNQQKNPDRLYIYFKIFFIFKKPKQLIDLFNINNSMSQNKIVKQNCKTSELYTLQTISEYIHIP